jgi:hypothetical protein
MRVTHIFMLFFRNSVSLVYRHSDLEGSCSNGTKTRHVNLVVACGGTILVRVPVRAYIFFSFFLNIYHIHKHSNYAVTRLSFNYMFQKLSLLHWHG